MPSFNFVPASVLNYMRSFLINLLILPALFLAALPVQAQISFNASIKPSHLTTDEYATLRFVFNGNAGVNKFTAPSLADFEVVSGPNQESSMSSINGKVTQYTALSYIIRPRKTGNFTIAPATVAIGNQIAKSNTVNLTVTKGSGRAASPRASSPLSNFFSFDEPEPEPEKSVSLSDYILHKGENVAAKVDRNMALRLETNKTECYVGEPIIASYKFYTRLKSESNLSKNPSFNGFSVIDLMQPDATQSSVGTLNGKEYNVYTIRKAQLYPLQSGDIALESATIENDIQFLREDQIQNTSVFDALRNGLPISPDAMVTQHVSLSSKPIMIHVKPLPEAGKPASFHDAVGKFNMSVSIPVKGFSTDGSGILKVIITGAGNMHLITAPQIAWPQGIDGFDATLDDNLDKSTVPVSGTKTFTYTFTVSKAGNYTIPPVLFSYFDPNTASYKTIQSATQQLSISQGTHPRKTVATTASEDNDAGFSELLKNNIKWLIATIAAICLIIWFAISKKNKNLIPLQEEEYVPEPIPVSSSEMIAEEIIMNQKNPLEESELCLAKGDCNNFYRVLNTELRSFLGKKFNIAPAFIGKNNLEIMLDKCNIETPVALELSKLLEEIEWNLYSPAAPGEELQGVYKRSVEIVQTINEKCKNVSL